WYWQGCRLAPTARGPTASAGVWLTGKHADLTGNGPGQQSQNQRSDTLAQVQQAEAGGDHGGRAKGHGGADGQGRYGRHCPHGQRPSSWGSDLQAGAAPGNGGVARAPMTSRTASPTASLTTWAKASRTF